MDVRVLFSDVFDSVSHQEADAPNHVEALIGQTAQVGFVLIHSFGLDNLNFSTELCFSFLQAFVCGIVERLVAKTANIGHHRELKGFAAGGVGIVAAQENKIKYGSYSNDQYSNYQDWGEGLFVVGHCLHTPF